jgi:hypothetical protein
MASAVARSGPVTHIPGHHVEATPHTAAPSVSDADADNGRIARRRVVAQAALVYRTQFRRVASTALVVFGFVGAIDTIAVILVVDDHVSRPVGSAITSLVAAVLGMVGIVFYAGALDKVVDANMHGHPEPTIREIWHALPLRRLAVADVLLALMTLAGLALGVVPGVVVFTLFCVVGPVITIEDRPVLDALRRSVSLTRRAFWSTLVLVTVPVQFEHAVLHAIHYTEVFDHPVVPAILLNGALGAAIASFVGLVEVVLAHRLIARDATT